MPEDAKEALGHGIRAKRSKTAPSALIFSRWRMAMQRSSETIGAIAAALAKAQGELANPEKSLVWNHPVPEPIRKRSDLPLCGAIDRPRHRAQIPWRPRNRHRPDDHDRR